MNKRLISHGTAAAFAVGAKSKGPTQGLRDAVSAYRRNSAEYLDGRATVTVLASFTERWWRNEVEEPSTVEVLAMESAVRLIAQGIEAREGGDVEQAPREARELGPKDAPKRSSPTNRRSS